MKYVCDACEWVYDEEKGYPEGGIAPGTKWEDIPDDFECKEAVIKRNGKTSIFIVHDDLTVERRSVRVGLINDQMEEILEGVNEGETVAVTNQDKLADGVKIKVDEDYHDPSHGEQGNKS